MVTIATFNEPAKARQLKQRFQDAGLKADVHNEAPLQEFGFMSKPQANAKVMVDDNDFEKAQSLMIEWEAMGVIPPGERPAGCDGGATTDCYSGGSAGHKYCYGPSSLSL